VWSIDSGEKQIRQVDSSGALGDGSGWFRDDLATLDGLGIDTDGTAAYAASLKDGVVSIQKLEAQLGYAGELEQVSAPNLQAIDGGAVDRAGQRYYFGGYRLTGGRVVFDLYAYDLVAGESLGQVGSVELPEQVTGAGGTGDIVFDATGNLLLLWSNGGTSIVAQLAQADVPTSSGAASVAATLVTSLSMSVAGSPWSGMAFDSVGGVWIQRATATQTVMARLATDTGLVSQEKVSAGIVTTDLASCGSSTTLTLRKNIVSRTGADQFTLQVGTLGGSTPLASATTSGTETGLQDQVAGPVPVSEGARYTIAELGSNGASPGDYTITYGCAWAGGGTPLVAAGTALGYNAGSGRAQATLPAITGHAGDALDCTITNTAKAVTALQPRLTLTKALTGNRAAAGDQFTISVARSGSGAALASATTTGSGAAISNGTTSAVVAEAGQTYTIGEVAASGDLSRYSATFVCTWSGGEQFSRGALQASGGRMQAQLPAIPSDRSGQTLGCTITNQVIAANGLQCAPGNIYGIASGPVYRATQTGQVSPAAFTMSASNALAINRDGTAAFAANLSGSAVQVQSWTSSAGVGARTNVTRTGNQTGFVTVPAIIGGAIDPTTGIYYFGGYSAGTTATFNLYASDGSSYWQAAKISVSGSSNAASNNGDIAFDAQGNLYLVWSNGGSGSTSHLLARVNADQIAAQMPGAVPTATASLLTYLSGNVAVNGVTFDAGGALYVSYTNGYKRLDAATGADIPGSAVSFTGVVDLASCGLPPTMKLQKDVVGRANPSDQFTIDILSGSTTVQTATTVGSAVGIQSQVAGPMVVTVGSSYSIRESATGNASLKNYITGYSCTWSDETEPVASGILTGTSTSRSQTLSAVPAGKAGQQLVCTITNEPLVPATVSVKKTILDARGENPAPAAGWTMTVNAGNGTAGGGTVTVGGADTPTQTTVVGGSVSSPWDVTFQDSSASVDLSVGETQKPGYRLVDGTCVITPRYGEARTVAITDVTVSLTGENSVRPGDAVECEFRNQPLPGSVVWQKVDEHGEHLTGSAWSLTGPGVPTGTVVTDCVAASDAECGTENFTDRDHRAGYFKLTGLSNGNHTLVEQKAPAGYVLDRTAHRMVIDVKPEQTSCLASAAETSVPRCLNVDFDDPFVNRLQTLPGLPLTGGQGADIFLYGGGGLGALGVVGALLYQRRKRHAA